MAIQINEFRLPITPVEALYVVQRHTDSFGVFFDYDRILEYEADCAIAMTNLLPVVRFLGGSITIEPTKDSEVIAILKNRFNVSERLLLNKDGKVSIDATVRNNLMETSAVSEDVKQFVKVLDSLKAQCQRRSYLDQYKNLPLSKELDYRGHRMVVAHPTWSLLSTSRMSARNPSVQNIAKDLPDLITQPKGWILVRADSGQIEPRINFSHFTRDDLIVRLIIEYNDAYFGMLHFVLLTDDEEDALRKDFNTHFVKLNTEEARDKRQTLKTMSLAGSYGSHRLEYLDPVLAKNFTRKIVEHPLRLKNEDAIRDAVRNGVETFYGAFGTSVTPDETAKYKRGDKGWFEHVVRCGINNPIQTTASELMIHSVYNADRILSEHPNSHIGYYKHDEGCFYVYEDDNDIIDELGECTAYRVKGWIPIDSEVVIGHKLNKDNKSLYD